MKLDCQSDFVSLVWTETRPQVDTSLFRLGNCFPNSLTPTQAVFTVELDDCKFRQLVSSLLNGYILKLCVSKAEFLYLIGDWRSNGVQQ